MKEQFENDIIIQKINGINGNDYGCILFLCIVSSPSKRKWIRFVHVKFRFWSFESISIQL